MTNDGGSRGCCPAHHPDNQKNQRHRKTQEAERTVASRPAGQRGGSEQERGKPTQQQGLRIGIRSPRECHQEDAERDEQDADYLPRKAQHVAGQRGRTKRSAWQGLLREIGENPAQADRRMTGREGEPAQPGDRQFNVHPSPSRICLVAPTTSPTVHTPGGRMSPTSFVNNSTNKLGAPSSIRHRIVAKGQWPSPAHLAAAGST